jgi:hypothetical protein
MGMFDTIYCEKKLPLTKEIKKAFPDTDWSKADFQTKSLDNTMTTYSITKNGVLSILKIEGKNIRTMTKKEEEKARKQGKFCWPYKFVEKSRKYEKYIYNGAVNFYYYQEDKDNNTWDLEFTATFVKGKITNLVLDSAKIIHTAEENAANEKVWKDKIEAYERHPWTKTKKILNKITFGYWSRFWGNTVSRALHWTGQKLLKLQLWIVRTLA